MGSYATEHGLPPHEALAERFAAARSRVASAAHRTPVARSRSLDARHSARFAFKCENFQRMGAFKFRGAWNLVSNLEPEVRARGLVAYSSGNHAQAVALVAREYGVPATIVMPSTAPRVKLAAVREYGAEIVHHDRLGEAREPLAERLAREGGRTLVPPFDHPDILLGQGTAAAELFEDAGPLDLLLVPLGGGGLLSGCALAARLLAPRCRVIGVEPVAGDDGARSFLSGALERAREPVETIADGARTPCLSELTLGLVRRYAHDVVTVSDGELLAALRPLWERLKLVVEPTGALGWAAAACGRVDVAGLRVGVILSGGNADLAAVAAALGGA